MDENGWTPYAPPAATVAEPPEDRGSVVRGFLVGLWQWFVGVLFAAMAYFTFIVLSVRDLEPDAFSWLIVVVIPVPYAWTGLRFHRRRQFDSRLGWIIAGFPLYLAAVFVMLSLAIYP